MVTRGKLFLAAAALLMALPGVAKADGFRSYRVCGGDTFTTCAAVRITVVGNNVTVDVWNLSGNTAGELTAPRATPAASLTASGSTTSPPESMRSPAA